MRRVRCRLPSASDPLEQLADLRERLHAREILASKEVEPVFLDLLPATLRLLLRQQREQQQVTALADLGADPVEGKVMAEVAQGLFPGFRMEIHRVDQRAVDIEDDRLEHESSCHLGVATREVGVESPS